VPAKTIRRITISQSVALGSLALVAALTVLATQRLVKDAGLVSHTYEVRSGLRTMSAWVDDAKADVRGYLVTGDSAYTSRYLAAIDSAQVTVEGLRVLTADNPSQRTRVAALAPLLALRAQKLAETAALRPTTGVNQATYAARLKDGEAISSRIDSTLATMDATEAGLLVQRAAAERDSQQGVAAVAVALLLLGIVVSWLMRRALIRDLTGRARIEAELRASEARFAGILAIAADAIISIDGSGAIVNFNQSAERMFGHDAREILGQSLDLLIPPRYIPAHHQHVSDFAASGDTARRMGERREVAGRRRDGSEFPADVSISRLTTPTGTLFTAVVRDVTEQRRLEHHEHTLAIAGARFAGSLDYEATLKAVTDFPVHTIGDWCVLDIIEGRDDTAPRLRRIVSFHTDLARHTALESIQKRGSHWDSLWEAIDVMRTGQARIQPDVGSEWREAHAEDASELEDLRQLGVRSSLCVPLLVGEEVIGALTIGRHEATLEPSDLNLAKAVADQASLAIAGARLYRSTQRALDARNEVLAIVSHDLRTPASAITMCARTLLEHPPATAEERHLLHATILESAEWMHRLMRDLLDAASIDAGRLSVVAEPHAVRPVLDQAVAVASKAATDAGIALDVVAMASLPQVMIDRDRTLQVVANLVSNALRFTGAGGTVTISAKHLGDGVTISVRDSGTGIPAEQLPRLFDRFWQARQRGIGRGTGLGLTIAKGIVEAQGGRIWVESAVGQGSTFSFTVPLARAGSPERQAA
jgi:PAS domain S-box-containing protein